MAAVAIACRTAPPAEPQGPAYELTGSVEDIMIAMMEPAADAIFQSVAVVSSASGVVERAPQTDEDWARVERAALTLAEAVNLLRMPGRAVARGAGNPPESDVVPELTPDQIAQRIEADRDEWIRHTRPLLDAARLALEHARSRNVRGLFEVGGPIDEACESCHQVYWFPNAPKPPE
jgi:hypothetical protein